MIDINNKLLVIPIYHNGINLDLEMIQQEFNRDIESLRTNKEEIIKQL